MPESFQRDGWSPEAAQRLALAVSEVQASGRRGIAAIDLDDTCLVGDLGDAVFHRAAEQGGLDVHSVPAGRRAPDDPAGWIALAREVAVSRGPGEGYAWMVEAFGGWTEEALRGHARDTLDIELAAPRGTRAVAGGGAMVRSGIRVRSRTARLIGRLQDRGWRIWLVSASAHWAVEVAADLLGIPRGRVIGQRVHVAGGRLRPRAIPPPVHGLGKVSWLDAVLDAPPDLALGDSAGDRDLLGWARRAVLFDTGGEASLREWARREGWAVEPVAAPVAGRTGRSADRRSPGDGVD